MDGDHRHHFREIIEDDLHDDGHDPRTWTRSSVTPSTASGKIVQASTEDDLGGTASADRRHLPENLDLG